jgi:hypothetical protein
MSLLPWEPDLDCETHEWRSPDGETIRFVTRTEATQRFMPPVAIHTVKVPQAAGGRFRSARHDERLVTLPVVLPGPATGREELRRWARALDPMKGEGTLTVVQGDYAGRQLACVYEGGLDSYAEEYAELGLTTLGFRAAEPYWLDGVESSVTTTLNQTANTWFPFLPLILGEAVNAFSTVTVTNSGDVDAWPVVTAIGPGTVVTLTNLTTGLMWSAVGNIGDGSSLVVDTRPGHKTVRLDGTNAFSWLTDESVLWPLVPGPNRISIGFGNATTASSVSFAWRNRWLSA